MFIDFVNSLNDNSDIELLVMSRQIIVPNGNIPSLENNASALKKIEFF